MISWRAQLAGSGLLWDEIAPGWVVTWDTLTPHTQSGVVIMSMRALPG